LFISGTILLIFNEDTLKALVFPLAFLLLLIPPPISTAYYIGNELAESSSAVVHLILKTAGLPVTLTYYLGTPVLLLESPSDPSIPIAIDIGCSGIYSLVAFTVFGLFMAYLARGRLWNKGAIFFLGYPAIYALNIGRLTLIALIGYWYGQTAAVRAFHIFGGWVLVFFGILMLLLVSEKLLKVNLFRAEARSRLCSYCEERVPQESFCPVCGRFLRPKDVKISRRDICKMAVPAICATLVLSLEVPVFAMTQGLPEIIKQIPLKGERMKMKILPASPGFELRFIYRDTEYERLSKIDAALMYAYLPVDNFTTPIYVSIQIADARGKLHAWENCLNPTVILDLRDVSLLNNPPIVGRFFALQLEESETEVILYWFENMMLETTSGLEQKHVMISIMVFTQNPTTYSEHEISILSLGKSIVTYWQPLKAWSWLAPVMAWLISTVVQYGAMIVVSVTLAIAIITTANLLYERKRKRSIVKLFDRLVLEEEKDIIRAVHRAQEKCLPTGNAIASTHRKLVGKPIEMGRLLVKLREAEEAGLVSRVIRSLGDKPVLTWRSQLSLSKSKLRRNGIDR